MQCRVAKTSEINLGIHTTAPLFTGKQTGAFIFMHSCLCSIPLFLAGEKWIHCSLHPEQNADQADSTHLQQNQQVHLWLSEHRRCLWHQQLPGDQPR